MAQEYYFRHYQVEQGLSNNTIFSGLLGNNGFLWFGTKEGLNRFDGYNFKRFLTPRSDTNEINNNYIYSLSKDNQGQIWVGAQNGLYKVDMMQERLITVTNTIKDVHRVIQADNNKYWVLAQHGIYLYDTISRKLVSIPSDQTCLATALAKSQDGNIWIGDETGKIFRFNARDSIFMLYPAQPAPSGPITKRINKMVAAEDNELFICTAGQGLKKMSISDSTIRDIISINKDNTPIFARDVVKAGNDSYWFATESGIYIYHISTGKIENLRKTFLDPYSISDNAVYNLTVDMEGGIWAGTYFGGINYYPRQYNYFQKYYPTNTNTSISGNSVREIREDEAHQLWIGTEDAGLNKFDPASGRITQFKPTGKKGDISYSNIHGLLIDGNYLWVGLFEHGLDKLDRRTGQVVKHYNSGPGEYDLKSNFIVTIIKHSSGVIYFGTSGGLFRYRAAKDDFELVKEVPANTFISILHEDHAGTIWAGTHGRGVYYYNPTTGESAQYADKSRKELELSHIFLNDIYEDSRKNIWLATEGGGLIQLNSRRKIEKIYDKKIGMPSDYIFKVLEDNSGDIWVTTSKGLIKLDAETGQFIVYTKETGILNNQFNYSSGLRDHQGRLYFGSIKGMISFDPHDFKENRFKPPLYITGFQVHNNELPINPEGALKQSILYTDEIELPYDQSSISIDVSALSYTAPELTKYSYILEGLDDHWTELERNRKIYYTNLSPGTYRFKVSANAFNNNLSDVKELKIRILPPWWATGLAYTIYFLAFGTLISFLIITYHSRTQNKKEKEIYEAKIDFFTNVAHEIKTPLTLIKGPVENLQERVEELPSLRKDVDMLERNTNRLIALVQQILDFRQTETKGFNLYFTQVNISTLLEHVYEDFVPLADKRKLQFTLNRPAQELQVKADEDALEKIFTNLLSNAIKYADKRVILTLQTGSEPDSWQLIVQNDGKLIPEDLREKIFEPFFRITEHNKQKGTGIGLALSRSLAELHNGTIVCNSTGGLNTFILTISAH